VIELALPSNGWGVLEGLVAGLVAEGFAELTVASVTVTEGLGAGMEAVS
jgi:hypothetical protein